MRKNNSITSWKDTVFLYPCFAFVFLLMASADIPSPKGEIVCFGDSITNGAKVDGDSWVEVLRQRKFPGAKFINEGRNGRKTADKKELLPVLQKYPNANYFLIFLGVNDLKNGDEKMVDSCVQNMKWMIEMIKKANPRIKTVILSPTDINLHIMSQLNIGKQYNECTKTSLRRLETRYSMLAKEEHVGFISLLHTVSAPDYADGLHPNIAGQREIADAVWKGLNR